MEKVLYLDEIAIESLAELDMLFMTFYNNYEFIYTFLCKSIHTEGGQIMNKNLVVLFDKIINDSNFTNGMKEKRNLKDLYEYCLAYVNGYTLEEFKEFLKSIIFINNRISGKIKKLSDEQISNVSAGVDFYSPKNKFVAVLMSGLLLAGCSSDISAGAISAFPSGETHSDLNTAKEKFDFNSEINKIVNNINNDAKQALQTAAKVAENCLGGVLDFISPKVSALENHLIKPTINSWPKASEVTVGSKVGQSKLSGGSANVDGKFSWLPVVENETLITPGTKTYICQFVPKDNSKYSKVTNSISFEVKAPKMNINWPKASSIVYGQQISDSKLSGGSSNVPGTFEWDSSSLQIKPNAGVAKCKVVFKPEDTTVYSQTYNYINVKVEKAGVQIFSLPSASSITYGQSLKCSNFSNFTASVAGKIEWQKPNLYPQAGDYIADAVFVPSDSNNYAKVTIPIFVRVNKQTPRLHKTYYVGKYRPNLCLKDFNLPSGWHWQYSNVRLESAGKFVFNAIHYEDKNYNGCIEQVLIEIEKIYPPKPQDKYITYDANKRLEDIYLPAGWHWENPYEVPRVDKRYYKAYFRSNESGSNIYKDARNVDIKINVKKAVPIIYSYPIASSIVYGQSLQDSQLSGFSANVDGVIKWKNSFLKPNAGICTLDAEFEPYDYSNYESVVLPVMLTVNKLKPTLFKTYYRQEYMPNLSLRNFSLPDGWRWADPDCSINDIGTFHFEAIHSEDQNNYWNSQNVTITIERADPTLSLPDMVYNESTKLKDIKLPVGWHFLNEDEVPIASKTSYFAKFDANEAQTNFYNSKNQVDVKMNVKKATPKVEQWPETSVEFSDNIKDTPLKGVANIAGEFKLIEIPQKIGENLCGAEFIPNNPNYETLNGKVKIHLSKNMTAENAPDLKIKNVNKSHQWVKFDIENNNFKPLEFSLDGGKTWQDSPEFNNLNPNTAYNLVYRFKETEFHCASKISKPIEISTKKSPLPAPHKPKVVNRTNNEIILEDNRLLEFSIDNGKTWQDSCVFSNLKRSTEYAFISRIKGDDDSMPSLNSSPTKVSTRSWFNNFIVNGIIKKFMKIFK